MRGSCFVPNLMFPTYDISTIRNELILNEILAFDTEPAVADRHLIFVWAGMWNERFDRNGPPNCLSTCGVVSYYASHCQDP